MYNFAKTFGVITIFGAMSLLTGSPARAQVNLAFSVNAPSVSADLTLVGNYTTLSGFSDPVFIVTGASGSYSDAISGITGTFSGILPSQTYSSIPNNSNHDNVAALHLPFPASYDNILYPNNNSPVVCDPVNYPYHGGMLDIYGLMLTLNLSGGGEGLVNIWSNGDLNDPSAPHGLDYGLSDGLLVMQNNAPAFDIQTYLGSTEGYPHSFKLGSVTFQAVPEPSALLILGAGIAAVPLLRLRRNKRGRRDKSNY